MASINEGVLCKIRLPSVHQIYVHCLLFPALNHQLNLSQLVFDVMSKGRLEVGNYPDYGVAGVLQLLANLQVNIPNHTRQIIQCNVGVCFIVLIR